MRERVAVNPQLTGYREWEGSCLSFTLIECKVRIRTKVPHAQAADSLVNGRSVGGFAGSFFNIHLALLLFFQQASQFRASLVNQGCGELMRRLLPFGREILHSKIQQWNIIFEPAQSFLYARNPILGRDHEGNLRSSLQIATLRGGRKSPTGYRDAPSAFTRVSLTWLARG
jgi:hypothetical protein